MKHLLLIEDDDRIARELIESFEKLQFLGTHLKTVSQADVVDLSRFSLAIIDWNLPDGEGIDIVSRIRAQGILLPILMLTANTDANYRKMAMASGVSDFLGKPFYFHELRARVDVLLESPSKNSNHPSIFVSGDITLFKHEQRATFKDKDLVLTKKEFELLLFFVTHPGTVFSRNELLDVIWGEDIHLTPRTVDTHVLHLRKKLSPDLFLTVWSSGYRYVEKSK